MIAAQAFEAGVIQRLNAQRHPLHPGGGDAGETVMLHRIGFQPDLTPWRQPEQGVSAFKDGGDRRRLHQRGRAAAKVHAVDRARPQPVAPVRQIVEHGGQQRLRLRVGGLVDVEVAIRADARAIRPVHVKTQAIGRGAHAPNTSSTSRRKAWARWLMACLIAGSISAKVSS